MARALNGYGMRLLLISLLLGWVVARAGELRVLVQSSPLAGFAHYAAPDRWPAMKAGDRLDLVREPANPHDDYAVRVDWHGEKLGYLPRADNRAVAEELDRGGRVEARIARLRSHPNPRERVLIDVYVAL